MDTKQAQLLMRQFGVDDAMLDELQAAAAALPAEIQGNAAPGIAIDGLGDSDAQVLMSRLLRAAAPALGVQFDHPDLLGLAGYPAWRQLIARAEAGWQAADSTTTASQYQDALVHDGHSRRG